MTLLVVAYSNFDPVSAKKYAAKIAEISGGKDSGVGKDSDELGAELEKLAVPVFKRKDKKETTTTTTTATTSNTTTTQTTTATTTKTTAQGASKSELSNSAPKTTQTQTKKKKKRRNKPAKKIDSGKPVDPERWLPKQERSYYKGKRRGKATGNKGAQGAIAASAAVRQQEGNVEAVPSENIEVEEKPQKLTAKQLAEEKAAAVKEAVQAAASARGAKAAPRGRGRGRGRRK